MSSINNTQVSLSKQKRHYESTEAFTATYIIIGHTRQQLQKLFPSKSVSISAVAKPVICTIFVYFHQ